MFRTSWKTSYADKAAGGRRQQQPPQAQRRGSGVGGQAPGGGGAGHGGGQVSSQRGPDFVENGRQTREVNILLRDERVSNAAREKFLFNQRIKMEEKRTRLAKGNILNFLMDRKSVEDKRVLLNKVLRLAGFKTSDISGIKLNDYRDSQAEVLLKDEVSWDIEQIERKLKEAGLNVGVSRFDDKEEVINIFGLPLTNDILGMKEKIREALEPFVGRVKDILATVYNGNGSGSGGGGGGDDDFFGGLYDGNYRVKVTPLKDVSMQVPNFIVVDREKKVCAKAVYSKAITEKKNMCTNCYATDHFRDNVLCRGPKSWEEYAAEFEGTWLAAFEKKSEVIEDIGEVEVEESQGRYMKMLSDLKKKTSQQEEKMTALEAELKEYKKLSEGGDLRGMDVEGGNVDGEDDVEGGNVDGEDDGGVKEDENVSMSSETFVDTEGDVDNASGQETEAAEAAPPPKDPLRSDWAQEMVDLESNSNIERVNKRKDVSPIVQGLGKKGSNEMENRRKFAEFAEKKLQVGSRYEFLSEGKRHSGTFLRAVYPYMEFKLDNQRTQRFHVLSDFMKLRSAPQSSI